VIPVEGQTHYTNYYWINRSNWCFQLATPITLINSLLIRVMCLSSYVLVKKNEKKIFLIICLYLLKYHYMCCSVFLIRFGLWSIYKPQMSQWCFHLKRSTLTLPYPTLCSSYPDPTLPYASHTLTLPYPTSVVPWPYPTLRQSYPNPTLPCRVG